MIGLPRLVRSLGVVALLPAVAFCAESQGQNSSKTSGAAVAVAKNIIAVASGQVRSYKQALSAFEPSPLLLFAEDDDAPQGSATERPARERPARGQGFQGRGFQGPGAFRMLGQFGGLLPRGTEGKLKLSDEQKEKLSKLRDEYQKAQFEMMGQMRDEMAKSREAIDEARESGDRGAMEKLFAPIREKSLALHKQYADKALALLDNDQKKEIASSAEESGPGDNGSEGAVVRGQLAEGPGAEAAEGHRHHASPSDAEGPRGAAQAEHSATGVVLMLQRPKPQPNAVKAARRQRLPSIIARRKHRARRAKYRKRNMASAALPRGPAMLIVAVRKGRQSMAKPRPRRPKASTAVMPSMGTKVLQRPERAQKASAVDIRARVRHSAATSVVVSAVSATASLPEVRATAARVWAAMG